MAERLTAPDVFEHRHIGPTETDIKNMLEVIKADSLEALIDETVPAGIRLKSELRIDDAKSEYDFLENLRGIAHENSVFKSYIGLGYYNCFVPPVIQRNVFENPGWYTQYTPYQAEISQGRLEALLNFQTMVTDLTAMEVANASLLDEATAAAEAMGLMYRARNKRPDHPEANRFFVSSSCFPQTTAVIQTRAETAGIELVIGEPDTFEFDASVFGAIVQYPDERGNIRDYTDFVRRAHEADAMVCFATDLLALAVLTPPGELGADVVVGNSQRFGVPLGFGGPHAAFFATREQHARLVPGRIIGVSRDRHGAIAYRMALQTREQHIRREKATSNICTAQALLAIMAGMFAVYHGPEGIRRISENVHRSARLLSAELEQLGYRQLNDHFFDTVQIEVPAGGIEKVRNAALNKGINFRYLDDRTIGISVDQITNIAHLNNIVGVFAEAAGVKAPSIAASTYRTAELQLPENLKRESPYLTHAVFNMHHSETQMLRYIKSLESKDLSLTSSMIPLGSCTMKLNATTEMLPLSWDEFSSIHPFVPADQARGYLKAIRMLEEALCEITGFPGISLQPNSGAQGEYTGLAVIRAFHRENGAPERDVAIIPSSAHGTNPASAIMAGMRVVVVKCDEIGNIDLNDLREKAVANKERLAALMVTYPSTFGIFEERIKEVCQIVHENGGQVYMDGANMNAQVGLTNPAVIGADVCHLNLHKTFAIPHGGGGPGMGPICVAKHLVPFLPGHPLTHEVGGEKALSAVSAAPWGSPSILLISLAYIQLLGKNGLTNASRVAILSANYIKSRLESHYPLLFQAKNGRVAHEMILDFRQFKKTTEIDAEDVAKRLMDYGFHAPTVSFPVPGALMIEPTESEPKAELDRFCDAMIAIREEIRAIENGQADAADNVLKNAPHTVMEVTSDSWDHPYSRRAAAFPSSLALTKFWPPVGRIDNTYGDRNLICSCPPMEAYSELASTE